MTKDTLETFSLAYGKAVNESCLASKRSQESEVALLEASKTLPEYEAFKKADIEFRESLERQAAAKRALESYIRETNGNPNLP